MSSSQLTLRLVPIPHQSAAAHDWRLRWVAERLAPMEQRTFSTLKGQRANEWLAGRVAAKDAVVALQGDDDRRSTSWPEIHISSDAADHGRPVTCVPYHISISHSHGLAAAAAATAPVGIDVEKHTRRWPRGALELLAHVTVRLPQRDAVPPSIAWTCAEAVLKQRGCGIRHGIDVVELTRINANGLFEWVENLPRAPRSGTSESLKGMTCNLGSHALALVWQEPSTPAEPHEVR